MNNMFSRRSKIFLLALIILLLLISFLWEYPQSPSENTSSVQIPIQPIDGVYILTDTVELTITNTLSTTLTLVSVEVRNPLVGSCQKNFTGEILSGEQRTLIFPCDNAFKIGAPLGVNFFFTQGTFGDAKWVKVKE